MTPLAILSIALSPVVAVLLVREFILWRRERADKRKDSEDIQRHFEKKYGIR